MPLAAVLTKPCNDPVRMKFASIHITGFKRFADPAVLRVRGKTLALLGHNESGKTSLLDALAHLSREGFAAATEFTDRATRPGNQTVLSARFVIEEADVIAVHAALEDRAYVGAIRAGDLWGISKRANGRRYLGDLPGLVLVRDVSVRERLVSELATVEGDGWESLPLDTYNEDQQKTVQTAIAATKQALEEHKETDPLPDDALAQLASLLGELVAWSETAGNHPALDAIRRSVSQVEANERADSPSRVAELTLFARIPKFIVFDEDARQLPSFTAFTEDPAAGLTNLLAAGGTTFAELSSLAGQDDSREALSEQELQINRRLELLFRDWSQREVTPAIRVDASGIQVVGRDRNSPLLDSPLAQRSEGMRMFAALAAFLHARDESWSSEPVLLVDEAELHLHYDAQADLIRVFDRQRIAQCVVYTTHSVGCLPEDLGLGIVVIEECGEERSRISQSFWTRGPGLRPVMLALGATALSFTPARRVVIGEGAHEAILLPTLLRQVRENQPLNDPLGFQIVGGLAGIPPAAATSLEEEAGTVIYIVDNDDGGRAAAKTLPKVVRDSGRVFTLGEGTDASCIEDFVSAEILVKALDDVLKSDGKPAANKMPSDVPASGRAAWLSGALGERGIVGGRTRIAQTSVIAGAESGLIEPSRLEAVQALLAAVEAIFPAVP